MNPKKINFWIDILFCMIFLPLVLTLIPVDRWLIKYPWFATTLLAFLYILYFIYRRSRFPELIMQKRYARVAIIMAMILLTVYLLSQFPFPESFYQGKNELDILKLKYLRKQTVWLMFLVVSGFSLSVELVSELFRQIIKRKDVEMEKNKAQLSLYKAQIDPHFLFNSLNALYGLILGKSDKTEQFFVKFTNLLQYMYLNAEKEKIPLSEEIEYLKHYIDLQSLRWNQHTKINWEEKVKNPEYLIAPMLLITFVENTFKYGASSSIDCQIDISLEQDNRHLLFKTRNNIMRKRKDDARGFGIENCRKRLELLYPNSHSLHISDNGKEFKVNLCLELEKAYSGKTLPEPGKEMTSSQ